MTVGFVFWLLMILWLILGIWLNWPLPGREPAGTRAYHPLGGHLFLFVLLFLLGWGTFGWPIKG